MHILNRTGPRPPLEKQVVAIAKRFLFPFRVATAPLRALPDFIILGAQKAGSSSLYNYLKQHPSVLRATTKEVSYFDGGIEPDPDFFNNGLSWYKAHFPFKQALKKGKITGEATPLYLSHPLAASRIHAVVPHAKLIAILRNPVERAISQYFHMVRKGNEPLAIMDALEAEERRIEPALAKGLYRDSNAANLSYKKRGLYLEQLKPYFDSFGAHQILVINSESLFKKTDETMQEVNSFLGIDPDFKVQTPRVVNQAPNKTPVAKEVYDLLYTYYEEPNRQLFSFLGKTFDWKPKG